MSLRNNRYLKCVPLSSLSYKRIVKAFHDSCGNTSCRLDINYINARRRPTTCLLRCRTVHTYFDCLAHYAAQAHTRILAYCLMDNHIHLAAVPEESNSLAITLRRAHGRYRLYLNARRQRPLADHFTLARSTNSTSRWPYAMSSAIRFGRIW